jgi:hypothetical protein
MLVPMTPPPTTTTLARLGRPLPEVIPTPSRSSAGYAYLHEEDLDADWGDTYLSTHRAQQEPPRRERP